MSGDDQASCSFLFLFPVKFTARLLTPARINKKRKGELS
jgi:hypothetical protein